MGINGKPKILCASLLAAFGSLSANSSTPRFGVNIGKLTRTQDGPILAYYNYWKYPVGRFYYTLYTDTTMEKVILKSKEYTLKMNDESTPWYFRGSIPKQYYNTLDHFYLVCRFETREDRPFAITAFAVQTKLNVNTTLGEEISLVNPTPNTTYKTKRLYGTVESQEYLAIKSDTYYIGEWKKDIANGLLHSINLPSCIVGYSDAIDSNIDMGGNAVLYVYTDPSTWNIGSLSMEQGQLIRTIPLNVNYVGGTVISGRYFRMYAPSLAESYIVDRYNLKMYPKSSGKSGSNYFTSTDLFIPIRNKKESKTWRFGLHWFNLSEFGDTINMDFSINVSSNFFGNCDDSRYCIGLGNP